MNPSLLRYEMRCCDGMNSPDEETHRLHFTMCLSGCRKTRACRKTKSPFRKYGLCMFVKSKVLSLGGTPEVMSPWKHEHSSPHLSRSQNCPCSRKKHFLALVSSQGSPAPVSCFWSSKASCGGPWGSWSLARGRLGRALCAGHRHHDTWISWGMGQEPTPPRSCHSHSSRK